MNEKYLQNGLVFDSRRKLTNITSGNQVAVK